MYLGNYIKENGKLTDYSVFTENGISGVVKIPSSDLFLAQFKDNFYNAVDIVVKYMAIENYFGINNNGFKLYQKMQEKRINENWNNRFISLIKNVEKNGYNENSFIETDINYSIHDGAHRLALALFFGIKDLNIKVFNTEKSRRIYNINWFIENGFTKEEVEQIKLKMSELIKMVNSPYYCVFWTPARNIFSKLERDLINVEEGVTIVKKECFNLDRDTFTKFMYDIYSTDDIAKYKLDLKYNYLMNSLSRDGYSSEKLPIVILQTILDIPDFKMKGLTGLPQSKKTMRLKKQVRALNRPLITEYYYDIIMHMTDNNIQNEDVGKILKKIR